MLITPANITGPQLGTGCPVISALGNRNLRSGAWDCQRPRQNILQGGEGLDQELLTDEESHRDADHCRAARGERPNHEAEGLYEQQVERQRAHPRQETGERKPLPAVACESQDQVSQQPGMASMQTRMPARLPRNLAKINAGRATGLESTQAAVPSSFSPTTAPCMVMITPIPAAMPVKTQ